MKNKSALFLIVGCLLLCLSCTHKDSIEYVSKQPIHIDKPYWQKYSIKYDYQQESGSIFMSASDRNGVINIVSDAGLLHPHNGHFLYPGILAPERRHRPIKDKQIRAVGNYQDQLVYLDNKAVLSNAWAGSLYEEHGLPQAGIFAGGSDFTFLVSDGTNLSRVKPGAARWTGKVPEGKVRQIRYAAPKQSFFILTEKAIYQLSLEGNEVQTIYQHRHQSQLTSFDLANNDNFIIAGSNDGFVKLDVQSGNMQGDVQQKLPWTEITWVESIEDKVWFGTTKGAFSLNADGTFSYYYGKRWLPGNEVLHITAGPEHSVLVLTDKGLGKICFEQWTLADKARFFDKQVRSRQIRHGFNSGLYGMENGDISTGYLRDSDNDGLWTSMYLAAEAFRYAVTKDADALENTKESLDAMERLYTVNPVPGFPSRSFYRSGYKEILGNSKAWQPSDHPEWDWKSTTSSDEAIGHIFAFGVIAEIVENDELKRQAIDLIDTLMSHVVKNDFYLIDYDGEPTLWGKWHPDYVNGFPTNIGDRKLNSSNIVAMLQTAYHFTGKEKYKDKAFELMHQHGYFENLMRPMAEIGMAPDGSDDWAKMLSSTWNHSDDEMYYMGYWGLYRYAFNDTLKAHFKASILDHWEAERPEKEGLWNIMTALTETEKFDLDEAIWYLQEYPLDQINWVIINSHRKDIVKLEPNFRNQTIEEVLSPAERPIQRHNSNMFNLDRPQGDGMNEHSAGDIWLLPYWIGRYLNVISESMAE